MADGVDAERSEVLELVIGAGRRRRERVGRFGGRHGLCLLEHRRECELEDRVDAEAPEEPSLLRVDASKDVDGLEEQLAWGSVLVKGAYEEMKIDGHAGS